MTRHLTRPARTPLARCATAATSASDVWAVGGTDWFKPQPLIRHWNGKTWSGPN
ncbi:MAG TPA: hypothetical protein VGM14_24020 [Streptosporangiaceae bacterium]|jgi:hypothetical protein